MPDRKNSAAFRRPGRLAASRAQRSAGEDHILKKIRFASPHGTRKSELCPLSPVLTGGTARRPIREASREREREREREWTIPASSPAINCCPYYSRNVADYIRRSKKYPYPPNTALYYGNIGENASGATLPGISEFFVFFQYIVIYNKIILLFRLPFPVSRRISSRVASGTGQMRRTHRRAKGNSS